MVCDKLVVKNKHQNDMCYSKIGLCDLNIGTILATTMNMIGRVYAYFESKGIFNLDKYPSPNQVMKLKIRIFTNQIC